MKKLTALTGFALFVVAGPASALEPLPPVSSYNNYGQCISTYNQVSKENFGPPGKNTYPTPATALSPSDRAQQQKADREAFCSSLKNPS